MKKILLKGNEAIALAAIKGGCEAFFGYPITPQNEVPEYLSKHMKEEGRVFVQAESEVSAINMVYGAAAAGVRVLTSSSSPGIALKQEGISYLAGAELPCVIINVMRAGPGLGGIQPSQADYYQITRGGGNGDYQILSYAPENLQETVDIIKGSFDKAFEYRNPVMIAVDGLIGQMMEPIILEDEEEKEYKRPNWATDGKKGGARRVVSSLFLDANDLEQHNLKLTAKYNKIFENEQAFEYVDIEDAEIVLVAYGTMARVCRSAMIMLKKEGIKVGLIRPITLWPFPYKAFENIDDNIKGFLTCEMSMGQMVDDVKLAVNGRRKVNFFGRAGGVVPEPNEVYEAVLKMKEELK